MVVFIKERFSNATFRKAIITILIITISMMKTLSLKTVGLIAQGIKGITYRLWSVAELLIRSAF